MFSTICPHNVEKAESLKKSPVCLKKHFIDIRPYAVIPAQFSGGGVWELNCQGTLIAKGVAFYVSLMSYC